jgi:hypothetical protein
VAEIHQLIKKPPMAGAGSLALRAGIDEHSL